VISRLIGIGEVIVLVNGRTFLRVYPAEDGHPPLEGRKMLGFRVFRFFPFLLVSFLSQGFCHCREEDIGNGEGYNKLTIRCGVPFFFFKW